jgi:mono/diheme cytochrome c family protein
VKVGCARAPEEMNSFLSERRRATSAVLLTAPLLVNSILSLTSYGESLSNQTLRGILPATQRQLKSRRRRLLLLITICSKSKTEMKTFVKTSLIFIILLLCVGLLLLQRSSRAENWPQKGVAGQESQSIASEQAASIPKLFDEKCARCHGADGRGHTMIGGMLGAPDFADEKWWKEEEKSERRFVHSITNGRGNMPAFGKKLSRREIRSLADYVRGFRPKTDR